MLTILILFIMGYILVKGKGKEKALAIAPIITFYVLIYFLSIITSLVNGDLLFNQGYLFIINLISTITTLILSFKIVARIKTKRIEEEVEEWDDSVPYYENKRFKNL